MYRNGGATTTGTIANTVSSSFQQPSFQAAPSSSTANGPVSAAYSSLGAQSRSSFEASFNPYQLPQAQYSSIRSNIYTPPTLANTNQQQQQQQLQQQQQQQQQHQTSNLYQNFLTSNQQSASLVSNGSGNANASNVTNAYSSDLFGFGSAAVNTLGGELSASNASATSNDYFFNNYYANGFNNLAAAVAATAYSSNQAANNY